MVEKRRISGKTVQHDVEARKRVVTIGLPLNNRLIYPFTIEEPLDNHCDLSISSFVHLKKLIVMNN